MLRNNSNSWNNSRSCLLLLSTSSILSLLRVPSRLIQDWRCGLGCSFGPSSPPSPAFSSSSSSSPSSASSVACSARQTILGAGSIFMVTARQRARILLWLASAFLHPRQHQYLCLVLRALSSLLTSHYSLLLISFHRNLDSKSFRSSPRVEQLQARVAFEVAHWRWPFLLGLPVRLAASCVHAARPGGLEEQTCELSWTSRRRSCHGENPQGAKPKLHHPCNSTLYFPSEYPFRRSSKPARSSNPSQLCIGHLNHLNHLIHLNQLNQFKPDCRFSRNCVSAVATWA